MPVELRAGACMEVFGTDDGVVAMRRWSARRRGCLVEQGLERVANDELPEAVRLFGARTAPWSWEYLQETDPVGLADRLRGAGAASDVAAGAAVG